MWMAALVLCLAQAQPAVKIAVPGLSVSGLEARLGEAYVERFATLLARDPGLSVTTKRDIEQLLGMERQKQLLGCSENSSSCLAELAGGLGVDAVLSGSLARTGSSFTVTMRVVRAADGSEVASSSERLKNEDALSEWLEAEAPRLAERIRLAFGRKAPPAGSAHVERWIPGLVGAALVVTGAGLQLGARLDAERLRTGGVELGKTADVLATGKTLEATSWALIAVGAAGIAASVIWGVAGARETRVAVMPITGGAFVSVSGVFP